ncbi:MAG: SDR family oxidoreductase [Nitratireductor sp.]
MADKSARAIIVTGAAHGIGRAIVLRCLGEGMSVVALDTDAARLDDLMSEAGAGDRFAPLAGDVAVEETAQAAVSLALERFGRLDGIVSNAGIMQRASLAETSPADWRQVLDVNLTAAFLLARAGEAALRAAKGAMVLMASTRALMSEPDTFAYSASKGGLVALAHSLAASLAPDVRVNAISPGWIHTHEEVLSEADHAQHLTGRVGTAEDVAELAFYLLDGERSGFMTGANLVLDGGMTRKMIYEE